MNVAIGQTAGAGSIYIAPFDCLILRAEGGPGGLVPADYVSAYSALGTNFVIWSG
jgi:hypothetical protein